MADQGLRCWEWDVCAGIALLLEAGGHVVDANPPPSASPLWDAESTLPLAELGGRRYLAVRPCAGGRKEQERVMREVWRRVEPFTYARPAE